MSLMADGINMNRSIGGGGGGGGGDSGSGGTSTIYEIRGRWTAVIFMYIEAVPHLSKRHFRSCM
jgi:hypothetical protein